jgi:hypothetical protein
LGSEEDLDLARFDIKVAKTALDVGWERGVRNLSPIHEGERRKFDLVRLSNRRGPVQSFSPQNAYFRDKYMH